MDIDNKENFIEDLRSLCEKVYFGLRIAEACTLMPEGREFWLDVIANDANARRALTYARNKAKLDLLKQTHTIATSDRYNQTTVGALRHLIAARFGVCEDSSALALDKRKHEDMMRHREQTLRQWADFQSARMIADATHDQLQKFADPNYHQA